VVFVFTQIVRRENPARPSVNEFWINRCLARRLANRGSRIFHLTLPIAWRGIAVSIGLARTNATELEYMKKVLFTSALLTIVFLGLAGCKMTGEPPPVFFENGTQNYP
jgi:hypothetical protein